MLGEVEWDALNMFPERHICCNPVLAQFIVDDACAPVIAEGAFAKDKLDAAYVRDEEARVTRGYRRLRELATLNLPIAEYPLPEVLARRERAVRRSGT